MANINKHPKRSPILAGFTVSPEDVPALVNMHSAFGVQKRPHIEEDENDEHGYDHLDRWADRRFLR